jgi:hypothetical protein
LDVEPIRHPVTYLQTLEALSLISLAAVPATAGFYIFKKQQFWSGVLFSWLLLVLNESTNVAISWERDHLGLLRPGASPIDSTNVGLATASGWILALTLCAALHLLRLAIKKLRRTPG